MTPTAYLIGDSICAGYAPWVQSQLAHKVDVHVVPENGRDSRNILKRAAQWLNNRHHSVIHFNCGLHDIKRPAGARGDMVPLAEYDENLREIVALLASHSAALLWANTTPVADRLHVHPSFTRSHGDVSRYNDTAHRVMATLEVPVNDLHDVVVNAGTSDCIGADGVHMTETGYRLLGEQTATVICGQSTEWTRHMNRPALSISGRLTTPAKAVVVAHPQAI